MSYKITASKSMDWTKSIVTEMETGEREESEETEQDDYSNSDIENEHN